MISVVDGAVALLLLHDYHVFSHAGRRLERDVLDPERLEDVLLEVVVKAETTDAFNDDTRPIDIDLSSVLNTT